MNVILPKQHSGIVFRNPKYREDHRPVVLVHGAFNYRCESCKHMFRMWLEDGVEGKNKKQPCPFSIPCPKCGGVAQHSLPMLDVHLEKLYPLYKGQTFFAFDHKRKEDRACGIPSIFIGQNEVPKEIN